MVILFTALTSLEEWVSVSTFGGILGGIGSYYGNIRIIWGNSKISKPHRYKLLKITGLLFSAKTQEEVFERNMADWDFEFYQALNGKSKNFELFMISARNTCAFIISMWQKSPIGDLIEFVFQIAKP
jgi:hypothetical protein